MSTINDPLIPSVTAAETIKDAFRRLRLPGMAAEFEKQKVQLPENSSMPFNERLGKLCSAEMTSRKANRINRLLAQAHLPNPTACPEKIDPRKERTMNMELMLDLVTCSFVSKKRFVSFEGATGTGKSYLSSALGNAACRNGYKVLCLNSESFVLDLSIAANAGKLQDRLDALAGKDLLILDEWLKKPLTAEESLNVSSFINACYGKCSLIFCSQYPSSEWYNRIDCERTENGDSELADAIMDRITNNTDVVTLSSTVSMRKFYTSTGESITG